MNDNFNYFLFLIKNPKLFCFGFLSFGVCEDSLKI